MYRDIQLSGRARLTLKPTTGKCLPFIGGMQLCFLDQPDFNFDLEGLADICDWSFLRRKVFMMILSYGQFNSLINNRYSFNIE